MNKNKGFLITFEGCEGCGKTTQSELLKKYLEDKNFKVFLTREPGGNKTAEQIRNILLNPENTVNSLCELMLYEASRAQHTEEIIKKYIDKGYIVICDRFTDSTIAYQGYGRKIDIKIIKQLNAVATAGITPELTIYLDIKPGTGIKKAKSVAGKSFKDGDRIEREKISFHNRVRKGFLELVKKYPQRIKKIKTNKNIDITQKAVNKEIDAFLKKKKYV